MTWEDEIKEADENFAELHALPRKQMVELEKQTTILEEAKAITAQNAEYTKQISEYTIRNEKSSKLYFWASFGLSIFALIVAILSFLKPIKIDGQQFNQLINKSSKGTVSVSQVINYSEPLTTSTVAITRKLIRKRGKNGI